MSIKEKPPEFFKSIKTSLKSILKHPDLNLEKIQHAVIRANKIVIHTLQFLKLYCLHTYEQTQRLPVIDKVLINTIMKILCREPNTGKPPKQEIKQLKETLRAFYTEHYLPTLQPDELDYLHLNTVLDYLTEDILTMITNNIELHYIEYVERYVNVVWKKKFIIGRIKRLNITKSEKDVRIRGLCNDLRKIKNDLLNVENTNFKSKSFYHDWIHEQKRVILPQKIFEKNSIPYDIKCKPLDYFPSMIFMMKRVEEENEKIPNVFPVRSEIIPKYIRLDTTTLVYLLLRKEHGTQNGFLKEGNLKRKEDIIWKFFFRTEQNCFTKTGYSFHHMISTDGVGVSILLLRNDLIGKNLPKMKPSVNQELYIDEIECTTLQTKKIVAIDPGKCDLIYCVDGAFEDATTFRYSQDQRRKETKMKKYHNIQIGLKHKLIQGRTVVDYETELSNYNKKTLDVQQYKEYLLAKNRINSILFEFYRKHLFRKLKFSSTINAKQSEQLMINQFKKLYGSPEETIICIGDWEQKHQMRFKEPTLGKGMRTIFRRNKYQVYLVDEHKTSCKCSKCNGGSCDKFLIREHPNPKKDEMRLVHGLLRCKNGCGLWNRDRNGSSNIYKIAFNAIHNIARPDYLSRSSNHATLSSGNNQNLLRV